MCFWSCFRWTLFFNPSARKYTPSTYVVRAILLLSSGIKIWLNFAYSLKALVNTLTRKLQFKIMARNIIAWKRSTNSYRPENNLQYVCECHKNREQCKRKAYRFRISFVHLLIIVKGALLKYLVILDNEWAECKIWERMLYTILMFSRKGLMLLLKTA